jgi:DNA invertase Pin-like site-specific DNA recombinase
MRIAYSYVRWSKPEQGKGDSRRRQSVAKEICKRFGWRLDETMVDDGRSAYRGTHRKLGRLASFLEAIREGRVKPGTVLIVEDCDRLSREVFLDALDLVTGILRAGVSIYVVRTEREYSKQSVNANPFLAQEIIFSLILGHDESKKKAFRSKGWWEGRRKTAKERPVSRTCPAWLKYQDGKFVEVPEAASAVTKIVRWLLDGLGLTAVTKRLVNENVPPIGRSKKWMRSYVQWLAHSRQLLGEYQPHEWREGKRVPVGEPVKGYYPPVVSEADFDRLQLVLEARKRQTGPSSNKVTNLFTGLLKGEDGASLIIYQSIFKGKKYFYLASTSSLEHGKGKRVSIPYDAFEAAVLRLLREVKPENLTGNGQQDEVADLAAQVRAKELRLKDLQRLIEGDADLEPLVLAARNLEREKQLLSEKLEEAKVRKNPYSPETLGQAQGLIDALGKVTGERLLEARTRLRTRVKEFVKGITVRVEGENRYRRRVFCWLEFHGGATRGIWFSLNRGALEHYGLWSPDGTFSGADIDHFTGQLAR